MNKMFIKIFQILLLSMLFVLEVNATHIIGGDLSYSCIGNNRYEITLTLYKDCNYITDRSPSLSWFSSNQQGTLSMNFITESNITPLCSTSSFYCNGSTEIIVKQIFKGTLTLANNATNIHIGYHYCCRASSVTNISNPGSSNRYIELQISAANLCNSSPLFTNTPHYRVCKGQPVLYNHGAVDPDGDVLIYSLTPCLVAPNTSASYATGYSATQPLSSTTGFSIDPQTGFISYTPFSPYSEIGVICVLVQEYRNGVVIGSIMREMITTVYHCTNNSPTLTGIDSTTSYSVYTRAGSSLCFDIFSNDIDSNQSTNIYWNNTISGATLTSTTGTLATARFCWTPTLADIGVHLFTITVEDNYCPIKSQNIYTYQIVVDSMTCYPINAQVISTRGVRCSLNDGEATVVAANGIAPYSYTLKNTFTNQLYNNTTGIFDTLEGGIYQIFVTDSNGCRSLSYMPFIRIDTTHHFRTSIAATNSACSPSTINLNSPSSGDGELRLNARGGTPPYTYSLNGGIAQSLAIFSNLVVGTYSVLVSDSGGCGQIKIDSITAPPTIHVQGISSPSTTCSTPNGQVILSANGGTGNYVYSLSSGNSQTSPTFDNLAPNTYVFRVDDANNCRVTTSVLVATKPIPTVSVTHTNASCQNSCDGRARVLIDSSTNFNYSDYFIMWSNGRIGIMNSGLCTGNHNVSVLDKDGCRTVAYFTVLSPNCWSTVRSVGQGFSTNDGSMNLLIQLAPNPASTVVQAAYETIEEVVGLTVLNINGQTVYQKEQLDGTGMIEIKTEEWASGMYFVVLRNLENKVIETQKLIIRK